VIRKELKIDVCGPQFIFKYILVSWIQF